MNAMNVRDLLRKLTSLPVITDGLAEDMLAGNFRSVFKGQGMEFDEARHYQWGDDIRSIDWNASARFGTPFVKMYREEREITILLLLDVSASMKCNTKNLWQSECGAERKSANVFEQALITAALIAFSAERSGQRIGAFLFDQKIEKAFPPRKGRSNMLAFISGALHYQKKSAPLQSPQSTKEFSSNIRAAVTGAEKILKRRSMVVLISDFLSTGWERELRDLCGRHDVIAVRVHEPLDDFPDMGLVTVEDPETKVRIPAPTGSPSFKESWNQHRKDRSDLWHNLCRKAGAARLELPSDADAAAALKRFFGGRGGR